MVELQIDMSGMVNGESFEREEFIDPAEEYVVHLENVLNGIQAAAALLAGTGLIDSKAALQLNSINKVFVPPRQTTAQREAITEVPESGMVYDSDLEAINFFDGGGWQRLGANVSAIAHVRLGKTANQGIPHNTNTIVSWDSEAYDTDSMHDLVTNNSRITFNAAGHYDITAQIGYVSKFAGTRLVEVLLNGTTVIASHRVKGIAGVGSNSYAPIINIDTLYCFIEGDYIEMRTFQNSGVADALDKDKCHFAASIQLESSSALLEDSFSIADAAPLASPLDADSFGTWVFVQNDGQLSIT